MVTAPFSLLNISDSHFFPESEGEEKVVDAGEVKNSIFFGTAL